MEQRAFRLVLLSVAGMMLTALCRSSEAAVSLQLKLAKGRTYYQRDLADRRITQTVSGQSGTFNITTGMGRKLDVLDVDGAGNMRIRYTFIWCTAKLTSLGGSVSYDSRQKTAPPAGVESVAALVNQSYVVKLSPKGRVLDINDFEMLKVAVRKGMPIGASGNPLAEYVALFAEKNGLKEMTESLMAVYPDKPMELGQSWSEKRVFRTGGQRVEESRWTLQKQEVGVATVDLTSTIRTDPNMLPFEVGGTKMRFEISGTQVGTIRILEATGVIQMDQTRQQEKAEIKADNADDMTRAQLMLPLGAALDMTSRVEMSDKALEPPAE